jgi:adenylate kinase
MATFALLSVLLFVLSVVDVAAFRLNAQSAINARAVTNRTTSSFQVAAVRQPVEFQTSSSTRISRLTMPMSRFVTGTALHATPGSQEMKRTALNIIIAGAPAAGKGTQCESIVEQFGVIHLSTGDILRAAVKAQTQLGVEAKGFMDAGQLVPDSLIICVICDRLREADCQSQGWLLDGFPRTKSQADALSAAGMVPDCFVLLDVTEDVLVERVTGRRTDPETGKIYHMKFSPPPEEIVPRLVQRSDDTAEKIVVRYREFQSHIDAIRSSYADMTVLVDGALKKEEVTSSVLGAIAAVVDKKVAKLIDGLN